VVTTGRIVVTTGNWEVDGADVTGWVTPVDLVDAVEVLAEVGATGIVVTAVVVGAPRVVLGFCVL